MFIESELLWLILEILIFIVILIPTIIALVTGAPWVPTPMPRVKRVLELAQLKPGDRVYDLGCGDGRMMQYAAKEYSADAVGLELSPLVYFWARIRNVILRSKARILFRDYRRIDLSNAKALVFYLLPDTLKTLRPKFESELKPGTLVVSYAFQIDGWEPTYVEPRIREKAYGPIYVYEVVPKSIKEKGSEAMK